METFGLIAVALGMVGGWLYLIQWVAAVFHAFRQLRAARRHRMDHVPLAGLAQYTTAASPDPANTTLKAMPKPDQDPGNS